MAIRSKNQIKIGNWTFIKGTGEVVGYDGHSLSYGLNLIRQRFSGTSDRDINFQQRFNSYYQQAINAGAEQPQPQGSQEVFSATTTNGYQQTQEQSSQSSKLDQLKDLAPIIGLGIALFSLTR
jgi:hypothetical protein